MTTESDSVEMYGENGSNTTTAGAATAAVNGSIDTDDSKKGQMTNGMTKDSKIGAATTGTKNLASQPPPAIPHVEINQVSFSLVMRNLTVFTIKEVSQFMKTNVHVNPTEPSTTKKLQFLHMIIFLRNQYLKIYVLVKWCRTIKNNNFHMMIDLLNWFRITNAVVNNCIWAIKASLVGMANAKLPNVDLVTALEVLSLGRPNLPTHQFKLSGEGDDLYQLSGGMIKVPPKVVLQKLKDMNLSISIKIALMDVPDAFRNYSFKNGRIYIFVPDEYEIQLATTDYRASLFFVDMNFSFCKQTLPLDKLKLEKVINEILFKSVKPLVALHKFLRKYVLTLKLYMIYLELVALEESGKFSGGHLVHRYDSKRSIISIRYWLHSKMGKKSKITIGVDRRTENLILKWDNELALQSKRMPVVYTNILDNLESILDEIMFNHSHIIRANLLSKGVFFEDEENLDVLLFQIPTTCISMAPVQLKIDLISGVFYFKNPTPLLLSYVSQINRAENADELISVLQRLKRDKISQVLRNMFEKTGWVCSKVIKLDHPIATQVNTAESSSNNEPLSSPTSLLQDDLFIRLPNWPANWYLILTVVSSNASCVVEKRIGKIVSIKGHWKLSYLGNSNVTSAKLESMTYQKVLYLQKTILHRIVNHMIIDSLNQLKISNKISTGDMLSSLPDYVVHGAHQDKANDDNDTNHENDYTSIIILELESFLEGSKALNNILESSMFMHIDYYNSEISLFGKFKRDTTMIKCKCDELLIHFVPGESLAFYLSEKFTNLNMIVDYLIKFRQKLMQLVILTDVVERLHKNFASDDFKIVALKPNEISFKYLKNNTDSQDCTISIVSNEQMVENLTVQLSPSNPQHIIQPFIDNGHMDYHFIFNYLQFTSSLFTVLENIIKQQTNSGSYTMVSLGLHNVCEYQLVYHNPEAGTKITLIIELKNVSHNGAKKVQFYIHFSDEEHISTKSMAYPLVHQVRNQVFMLDPKDSPTNSNKNKKYQGAVRLVDGISCDPTNIEPILLEIHEILRMDSNVQVNPSASSNGIQQQTSSAAKIPTAS
ncbi:hypothetical protein ZYGR_0R01090 [Zygosaccharomyces rouxii]|uniref:Mediator of RNA polymerase II transcription subunit 14 n=1 Tax=Zygosaccharomyces rouxii TaxID=4956 RepID=A0A1Q3A2E5_ZYGRO|nr:hypothetical protein ZYGR_0R01090 [Zygosaccharomyces rouxii]